MTLLLAGLLLFLGLHSIRMLAPATRERWRTRLGAGTWKGLYSLLALAGLALIAWGFDAARENPIIVWMPSSPAMAMGLRHGAVLFTVLAFVLLAAAYVPGNHLKARLGHPMVLGVKTWAFAHLLVAGMLAHLVLFGSFLLWAIANYALSRRRDRLAGVRYPRGRWRATVLTVALGLAGWAVFAFGLHGLLIGIKPLG
ncbi:NnrU family protein [Hylemonella gracilis]|uniref:NnrU family protein n=1 Tax=Hylemonella gracilis TaxID=80880 RepID=A0A4P6UGI7_9BURK|nr:NnrU family protein [Hylemonella gracilis]QBK03973.1 NnrU family protein [Hylemonella gracilis]